jgi:hypothetical protein
MRFLPFTHYLRHISDNVSLELVYVGWDFGECQCGTIPEVIRQYLELCNQSKNADL